MAGGPPDPGGETVVESARIAQLLRQLRTRRAALAVQAGPEAASSLILEFDPARGRLVLDGLFPPSAQARVRAGDSLNFVSRLDGIAVRGTLSVQRLDANRDGPLIVAAIPGALLYAQRRAAYRVAVDGALPAGHVLHAGAPHRATFLDLSVLGLAARVAGDLDLGSGARMSCEMNLPGGRVLTTLEVRSATRGPGHVRIGARYLELDQRQRALLESTTANLQRTALKRARAS